MLEDEVVLYLNQLILVVHRVVTTLSCPDAIRLFNGPDKDLAITHFAGIG